MEKYVPRSAKGAPVRFLAVSAHKDDIEMFALDGIFKAYAEGGFAAAVLTDGGQCPRSGAYAAVSDEDMALLRSAEQKRAAEAGAYEALWLFEKTSAEVKRAAKEGGALVEELAAIMRELPPLATLYIHNPFDSHPTHVAACVLALQAARLFGRAGCLVDVLFRLTKCGQTLRHRIPCPPCRQRHLLPKSRGGLRHRARLRRGHDVPAGRRRHSGVRGGEDSRFPPRSAHLTLRR